MASQLLIRGLGKSIQHQKHARSQLWNSGAVLVNSLNDATIRQHKNTGGHGGRTPKGYSISLGLMASITGAACWNMVSNEEQKSTTSNKDKDAEQETFEPAKSIVTGKLHSDMLAKYFDHTLLKVSQ